MSKKIVTHRLSLDLSNQKLQATVTLGFGDLATHRLVVDLRHGADVLELPPGSYAIAVQNGVDVLDSVTVYGTDGAYPNCIVYDVTTAVTGAEGVHEAQFKISYVDEAGALRSLTSPKIAFVVKKDLLLSSNVVLSDPYSAVVLARERAERFAQNAESCAKASRASEANAKTSEENAADSATAAKDSADAAKTSEGNAADSAASAKTSEGNAADSAASAKTSEGNAADSAAAAKDSADAAKTSEGNAAAVSENMVNAHNTDPAAHAELFAVAGERIEKNEVAIDEHKTDSTAHAELFAAVHEKIEENKAAIDILDSKVTRNDKRLTNLEKGLVTDTFETDATVVYTKQVPENAFPYAGVSKIGGMSYKVDNVLRSAPVTELRSNGANLIINDYYDKSGTKSGITFTVHEDGSVTANGTATEKVDLNMRYTKSYLLTLKIGKTYRLSGCPSGGSASGYHLVLMDTSFASQISDHGSGRVFTAAYTDYYLMIRIEAGTTVNNLTFKPMLVEGDKVVPFKPYRADAVDTFQIPEAVRNIDGYGRGVDGTYHNYVDFKKKIFVKNVYTIKFIGTENWIKTTGTYPLYKVSISKRLPSNAVNFKNLQNHFPTAQLSTSRDEFGLSVYNSDDVYCVVRPDMSKYPTVESFKALLQDWNANGVPLEVDMAVSTPTITDISTYLTDDNFIEVEGGGTITAVNEHEYAVPSEIIYQVKEVAE